MPMSRRGRAISLQFTRLWLSSRARWFPSSNNNASSVTLTPVRKVCQKRTGRLHAHRWRLAWSCLYVAPRRPKHADADRERFPAPEEAPPWGRRRRSPVSLREPRAARARGGCPLSNVNRITTLLGAPGRVRTYDTRFKSPIEVETKEQHIMPRRRRSSGHEPCAFGLRLREYLLGAGPSQKELTEPRFSHSARPKRVSR